MTTITYREDNVSLNTLSVGAWFMFSGMLYLLTEDPSVRSDLARAFRAHDQLFVSFAYDTSVVPVELEEIIVRRAIK